MRGGETTAQVIQLSNSGELRGVRVKAAFSQAAKIDLAETVASRSRPSASPCRSATHAGSASPCLCAARLTGLIHVTHAEFKSSNPVDRESARAPAGWPGRPRSSPATRESHCAQRVR